jgi:ubiquinone/menaquinone biosynthesis C-methylase UbiE
MATGVPNYALGHHASVLQTHSVRTAAKCAAHVLPHILPHHRILDVGCGPGSITLDLAKLVSEGSAVGVDFSAEAVDVARQNALDRGVHNCEFRTGDVYSLDWPDGTFDIVVTNQCLVHLSDPARALMEMRRVCKVGGLVAAREGKYSNPPPLLRV